MLLSDRSIYIIVGMYTYSKFGRSLASTSSTVLISLPLTHDF